MRGNTTVRHPWSVFVMSYTVHCSCIQKAFSIESDCGTCGSMVAMHYAGLILIFHRIILISSVVHCDNVIESPPGT